MRKKQFQMGLHGINFQRSCYAICPVQAIHMEFDAEGFLYPLIDEHKCIGCYQCLKVCAYKKDKKAKLKRGLDE